MAETGPEGVTVIQDTKILSDWGTVAGFAGICEERPVSFFAAPRCASDLADAVEAEGPATAIADSYLVLFRRSARTAAPATERGCLLRGATR